MYVFKRIFSLFTAFFLLLQSLSLIKNDNSKIEEMFDSTDKICYSETYYELSAKTKNDTETWRQGMVSGNGMQGFVTSGSPYSDSIIYQNMHFIMPNDKTRSCPVVSDELETVKQAITKGENIVDNASYDEVYYYHPGGALRIDQNANIARKYVRYTNYETAEVGVNYSDTKGEWNRVSFTSKVDGVSITKITSSTKGSKVNTTISFDDLSTMANFGDGDEKNLQYKKMTNESGDYLALVAHYPSYANSELKNAGYATLAYIIVEGGSKSVTDQKSPKEKQFVGDSNPAVEIKDADNVYIIAVSDRDTNMGKLDDFKAQDNYALVEKLLDETEAVAEKYSKNDAFSYDDALDAHKALFTTEYNAVSFSLENGQSGKSNEALIRNARNSKKLQATMLQKAYYSGRYAYLCCAGYSTSRLYGMWTGEFATGWGSKYTMDANVNLQTSSMNSSNLASAPAGYVNFILRQLPDWEENAWATHGFTDALQAPVNTDGDKAIINETCYPYPFRYWNAGTDWMIIPMYETLLTYGNIQVPLCDEFNLDDIKDVLDLSDADVERITSDGYMMLQEDILYPMLIKSCNYWVQLVSPEYYTTADGKLKYEKGKTALAENEYYSILPSYSPENNPSNYSSPSTANTTIDISACRNNIEMLQSVSENLGKAVDAKYIDVLENLPPYLYDESGALKEWATTSFTENNEHRHLSHLYVAWPLDETQDNEELRQACEQAIDNRASENSASHALVHRALIADRLKDSDSLTDALKTLMKSRIYYSSLMTNHNFKRNSCYCTDYEIGYLGIINEALVYSNTGEVEILPAWSSDLSNSGSIEGLRLRTLATADSITWNLKDKTASVTITSDVDQTIKVSCPFSDKVENVTFTAGETKTVSFALNK